MELKSLKEYLFTYRNLGIFQENIVNQVLDDVVKACHPVWAKVVGDFRPRGGISTVVEATYPRPAEPAASPMTWGGRKASLRSASTLDFTNHDTFVAVRPRVVVLYFTHRPVGLPPVCLRHLSSHDHRFALLLPNTSKTG